MEYKNVREVLPIVLPEILPIISPPSGWVQDISMKVDKASGFSLVPDAEILKIHSLGSDDQDLSELVRTNDPRLSDARTPLTHLHPYEPANANIQAHVISVHAPANAQANSDITKAEIEAKLTGDITSHSHTGGGGGLNQQQIEGLL
jgi:hypothetical protein